MTDFADPWGPTVLLSLFDSPASFFEEAVGGNAQMVNNPFLVPPQVESPQSRSWASGFLFGFQGPEFSVAAPSDLPIEDLTPFEMGSVAGQQAAVDGWPTIGQCIDLNVQPPSLAHFTADLIAEGGFTVAGIALVGVHVAGLFFEGLSRS
jgi:hypothetical protein